MVATVFQHPRRPQVHGSPLADTVMCAPLRPPSGASTSPSYRMPTPSTSPVDTEAKERRPAARAEPPVAQHLHPRTVLDPYGRPGQLPQPLGHPVAAQRGRLVDLDHPAPGRIDHPGRRDTDPGRTASLEHRRHPRERLVDPGGTRGRRVELRLGPFEHRARPVEQRRADPAGQQFHGPQRAGTRPAPPDPARGPAPTARENVHAPYADSAT